MRDAFIRKLEAVCESDEYIFLLTADLGFKLFDSFRKKYPRRFLNIGIAEPNMIGVAAGLALSGKKVYCYSMVPFLIMRCFEHIRIDICYNRLNVKLIGVGGGLTYGAEGVTHHATEDLALMRSLPNMAVVAPGDPFETSACINASATYNGPLFVRLSRNGDPSVYNKPPGNFSIGKGIEIFNKGRDVAIIATGSMLHKAKAASELLIKNGIGVTLISMHTIKPLDEALIKQCAKKYRCMVSIEEHSIIGGLGSAIAETLGDIRYNGVFKRIGLPDAFNCFVGNTDYLHEQYGLNPENMAIRIAELIREA